MTAGMKNKLQAQTRWLTFSAIDLFLIFSVVTVTWQCTEALHLTRRLKRNLKMLETDADTSQPVTDSAVMTLQGPMELE